MIPEPVVILANGNFPIHPIPKQRIMDANSIICCDGAVNQLIDNGLEPHTIIGDLDSIDQVIKSKYDEKIIHLPSQNDNDLRKAMFWADDQGVIEAIILGATGKRDDHSLSNIFTLLQFSTSMKCTLLTDHGSFVVTEGKNEFKSYKGQQVSFFSADPDIKITSYNLKYNLISTNLIDLYCGSLNESIDDYFTLTLSHGKILVYQVFV